jgi:ABC-type branched-subunit amino acid transport system ATPase component
MLTKISIINFKKFDTVDIHLGSSVVFVGPNNSGKTSALQAVTLWDLGMRKWAEKRKESSAKERIAATINRKDILMVPLPSALQLWRDLHVRKGKMGKNGTENILVELHAEGITKAQPWHAGFEFDYANAESIYCRIAKGAVAASRQEFPEIALQETVGFLPPMSGLSAEEERLTRGSINRLIGEGRTAQIVRNLCLLIAEEKPEKWEELNRIMGRYFRAQLERPVYNEVNGQISMTYREQNKIRYDLSNSGRGFQQVLLLFAYIFANQNSILLLDEPDAHLEIIRQKEIFNVLTETASTNDTQVILATHSEAVLSESAEKAKLVGFLPPRPRVVNDRKQLLKSLVAIGYDQYLLAEQKKWVLYLEGTTDGDVLRAFAGILEHPVLPFLENAFIKPVGNVAGKVYEHFQALKEAVPELMAIALFDNDRSIAEIRDLKIVTWQRREIENYLPLPQALYRYLEHISSDLFNQQDIDLMKSIVMDYIPGIAQKNPDNEWWTTIKMSDEFLDKVTRTYFEKTKQYQRLDKGNYFELARRAQPGEIDTEVKEKLDSIYNVAISAKQEATSDDGK